MGQFFPSEHLTWHVSEFSLLNLDSKSTSEGSSMRSRYLTCSVPGYNIFVLGNQPKTSSFQLPYQQHSSSADCARELFKPLKDSASLLVCNEKTFFGFGFLFFVSDIISEVGFWPFWLMLPGLGPNRYTKAFR